MWAQDKNLSIWFESTTTSTNQIAKDLAGPSKTPRLFLADHQTTGRGRGQNIWSDQAGDQLLSSWLFKMTTPPQPVLAPLVGLALLQSLQTSFPKGNWSLKAPNDIYLEGKKVAGILLESIAQGNDFYLIIGVGLNVWQKAKSIENSIALSEVVFPDEAVWKNFLNLFFQACSALAASSPKKISDPQRSQLLQALNLFPSLKTKYSDILPGGCLVAGDKKTEWQDL